MKNINLIIIFTIALWLLPNSQVMSGKARGSQFLDLSIEELMNVKVTTVSRRAQKLTEVASAVFVITQDDIRRSGVTNIPDALRMAPGVQVERSSTNQWAVSIRGFNGVFANKLQVLMDGRSVYSPIFSGALWEQQDTLMEDIDRIEVIRGPATTVWGVNAVSGVINIITKKAAETQGTLLSAGGGSFEHGFFGARYGGKINEETPFRVYAKGFTRDHTISLDGNNRHDQWHSARGGFRLDHTRGIDQFTVQGDIYFNSLGDRLGGHNSNLLPLFTGEYRGSQNGGDIRFRWDRVYSERSSMMLQTYYDQTSFQMAPVGKSDTQSFDIDFQHRFPLFDKHDVIWGTNYRLYNSKIHDTLITQGIPRERTHHQFSGFIRDDITLVPDRLLFSLGTRLDHNDFSGLEVQPNARLMWTPDLWNSIWLSISRSVRIPSRGENDAVFHLGLVQNLPGIPTLPIPIALVMQGSNNFNSEKLLAYELGFRHQFSPRASIDIAGFINDYSQLRDLSFGALSFSTGLPRQLILPLLINNRASALTYGFEFSADWKPTNRWRLQGNYSFLDMSVSSNEMLKTVDPTTGGAAKISPQHQISVRSNHDISDKLQFNFWLRYTSAIGFYSIPGFVTMDAKLAFKPVKNVELSLVGQNLFSEYHREFVSDNIPSTPALIPRGIYAGVRWQF